VDVLVVLLVSGYFLADGCLDRIDAVVDHALRPAEAPGQDWLLVGSGGSGGSGGMPPGEPGGPSAHGTAGRRIEAMTLLHVPDGNGRPTLVGLPRETYVAVPGHGRGTLQTAFAAGGPTLLVATVESGIGVRIDRYLEFPSRPPKGRRGAARPERQRALVQALARGVTSPGSVLLNPLGGVPILLETLGSITVDECDHLHHLVRLAVAMRRVGGGDAVMTTIPIKVFTSVPGAGPIALLDDWKIQWFSTTIAAGRPLPTELVTG
jgi:hypothetical protein